MLGCAQCPDLQTSLGARVIAETSFVVERIPVPEEQTNQQCQYRNEIVFSHSVPPPARRNRARRARRVPSSRSAVNFLIQLLNFGCQTVLSFDFLEIYHLRLIAW